MDLERVSCSGICTVSRAAAAGLGKMEVYEGLVLCPVCSRSTTVFRYFPIFSRD